MGIAGYRTPQDWQISHIRKIENQFGNRNISDEYKNDIIQVHYSIVEKAAVFRATKPVMIMPKTRHYLDNLDNVAKL